MLAYRFYFCSFFLIFLQNNRLPFLCILPLYFILSPFLSLFLTLFSPSSFSSRSSSSTSSSSLSTSGYAVVVDSRLLPYSISLHSYSFGFFFFFFLFCFCFALLVLPSSLFFHILPFSQGLFLFLTVQLHWVAMHHQIHCRSRPR